MYKMPVCGLKKTEISEGISGDFQFVFAGIDSSLNPSINRDGSIAYGFDMLDEISTFGEAGASLWLLQKQQWRYKLIWLRSR